MYSCFPWMRHCCGSSTRSIEGVEDVPECIQHVTGVRRGMELLQKIHRVVPPLPVQRIIHRIAFDYDDTLVFVKHPNRPQAIRDASRQFHPQGPLAALSAAQLDQQCCGIIPYITQENNFTVTYFRRNPQDTNTSLTRGLADKMMMDPFALMLTCWILTYHGYPCIIGSQRLCMKDGPLQTFKDMLNFKDRVFGNESFFFRTHEIEAAHAELSTTPTATGTPYEDKRNILRYWDSQLGRGMLSPRLVDDDKEICVELSGEYDVIHFDIDGTDDASPPTDLNHLVLSEILIGDPRTPFNKISQALVAFIRANPNMRTECNRFIASWPALSEVYRSPRSCGSCCPKLVCGRT